MSDNLPEVLDSEPRPQLSVQAIAEESRSVQLIQAKIISAKKFPRDIVRVRNRILDECKDFELAKVSSYQYPKGGELVRGPSIRLAEVAARNYGNLDYGVRELERRSGVSVCQAYCWDLENNVTSDKVFEVPHEYRAKGKIKKISDPREIYELVANNGARRMRACILAVIPSSVMTEATNACRKTLANGGGETIETRRTRAVSAFKDLGVSQEMIEERLGHKIDLTTGEELADLQSIYNSLKDKQAKRGDFFNFPEDVASEEALTVAEKIATMGADKKSVDQ